jgi:8-oxo-dGTP pyrophosphatase MutT (NUDIX family)
MRDAVVAIVTRGAKMLFIRRGPGVTDAGFWAPLSGRIERGEDQPAAVIRETKEEVGLTVKPLRKVWESLSARGTHRLHWWLAEWVDGDLRLDPREVSEARWLTSPEISVLENTFEKDREFFDTVLPRLGKERKVDPR